MPRRCMRGLTPGQQESKRCYSSWLQQRQDADDPESFCTWMALRVQCMESYLNRRGEELVCCGSCTQCWYVCTDMLLDILFNTQILPPALEGETVALSVGMMELLQPRRGHSLCDEYFLPKCVSHRTAP